MKITIQATEEIDVIDETHCNAYCDYMSMKGTCKRFRLEAGESRPLVLDKKTDSYRRCKPCKYAEVKP